jgi:hypothetical protein
MLSCRHNTRLISERLERSLSLAERLRLGVHLVLCPPCQRFDHATRWLHDTLTSLPADVPLPDEARERIRQALERAAERE